jgi:hypothetical protein
MAKTVSADSKNVIKNMIIGITTSVLGAAAIYFLGFNNNKTPLTKLEKEEATTEAWKTYVTVENIYAKNNASLLQDANQYRQFADVLQESLTESSKFQNSLQGLIEKEGADKDLVSLFTKRLKADKELTPQIEPLYKGLNELSAISEKERWPKERVSDSVSTRIARFIEMIKVRLAVHAGEIETVSKKLSEKYEYNFKLNDLLIIQAVKYKKDIFNLTNTDNQEPPLNKGEQGKKGQDASNMGQPASPGQ